MAANAQDALDGRLDELGVLDGRDGRDRHIDRDRQGRADAVGALQPHEALGRDRADRAVLLEDDDLGALGRADDDGRAALAQVMRHRRGRRQRLDEHGQHRRERGEQGSELS
jgi:hypothetical protein